MSWWKNIGGFLVVGLTAVLVFLYLGADAGTAAHLMPASSPTPEEEAGVWRTVSLGIGRTLWDAAWGSQNRGFVVGDGGTLVKIEVYSGYYTETFTSGTTATLYGVDSTDPEWAWVVGAGGYVARCNDNAKGCTPQTSGTSETLYDIDLVRYASVIDWGWLVGANGVVRHTQDGGSTWQAQDQAGYTFYTVHAADASHAWIGGVRLVDNHPAILYTQDGGHTWQQVYSGSTPGAVQALHGYGSELWAVGEESLVLHSGDGGRTWTPVSLPLLPPHVRLTDVWVAPGPEAGTGAHVWISGEGGRLLHSGDGGRTWQQVNTYTSQALWAVSCFNPYHGGLVVGDGGVALLHRVPPRRIIAYHASTPPHLDGSLDEWRDMEGLRLNAFTSDFTGGGEVTRSLSDYDVRMWLAWDDDALYLAFDIHDDVIREDNTPTKPWYDDELEITFDGPPIGIPDQGADDWFDGTDHQYTVNPSGYTTDVGRTDHIAAGAIQVVTHTVPTGWVVEMRIDREELGVDSLYAGREWGFTLGYHDDDVGPPGSSWDTYYIWEGYKTYPDSASVLADYGRLTLSLEEAPWGPQATPTPTETPTATPTPTTGTVQGRVFLDSNRNGVDDPGEPGIAGAVIRVRRNGSIFAGEMTTGSDGRFYFSGLEAGFYAVTESPPAGYETTTGRTRWFSLSPGQTVNIAFGEAPAATPTPTPTPTPTSTPTPVPHRHVYIPYVLLTHR